MKPFAPLDPMERGITLLEASAGTGKTYSITTLVVQLVALHDVPLREVLVVTFTRKATAELRDRVRLRLDQVLAALTQPARPGDDPLVEQLRDAAAADDAILTRLQRARADFDECVISTIHGFCQRMLQQFAAVAGSDLDLELEPDTQLILEDLVDDFLSRELYPADPERFDFLKLHAGFHRDHLLRIAKAAVDDPTAILLPEPQGDPIETYRMHREALREQWEAGGGEQLEARLLQAHANKEFKNPRQRTYTPKTLPGLLQAAWKWLTERLFAPPGDAEKLLRQAIDAMCDSIVIDDPTIDALTALNNLPGELGAAERVRFARWIRRAFRERCAAERIQSYADLIHNLADRVRPGAKEPTRTALIEAIGGSFQAALIDEFQDTDANQWTLFHEVFGQGRHFLYLIGDPKQAIYAFRGANVHVYLQARAAAGERAFTMTRNWRSDAGLLDAFNHLMDRPGFFGTSDIQYVPVDAPEREHPVRLVWPDDSDFSRREPFQLRYMPVDKEMNKGDALRLALQQTADDLVMLLGSGAQRIVGGERRPLRAGDCAVLVRTNHEGDALHQALRLRGVPVVFAGRSSVLASQAARELELWLLALDRAGREDAARTAATTHLFGRRAELLLALQHDDSEALAEWELWLTRLARWRDTFQHHGFLRALREALAEEQAYPRLLALIGGERYLTDLLHTAELVHTAEQAEGLGLTGVLAWLGTQRLEAQRRSDTDELRLERDDDAVQILTIHSSKGLEFPVVYAPSLSLWRQPALRTGSAPPLVPTPEDPSVRCMDMRMPPDVLHRYEREQAEESLRLLYVAYTRASCRFVTYHGAWSSLAWSPQAVALHGTLPDRIVTGHKVLQLDEGEDFDELRFRKPLEELNLGPGVQLSVFPEAATDSDYAGTTEASDHLRAATFNRRSLDPHWRRYSYTALTRNQPTPSAQPDEREGFDADALRDERPAGLASTAQPDEPDVPLADFPAGAKAGIFLHEIFEEADFQAPTDAQASGWRSLAPVIARLLPQHGLDAEWAEPLRAGLADVLRTPLGGPLGAMRLCDLPVNQRFDELRFDFPLAGGDAWGRQSHRVVRSADIVAALAEQDPRPGLSQHYLNSLEQLDFGRLAGFMTGSIDLAFQAPAEHGGRWYVADYKSNRLDPQRSGRTPVSHFDLPGMRHEMEHHHYIIQYHLYTVALHRYLRWRLPDYDYDTHMGGSYYLFFRGMTGEQAPAWGDVRAGCFFDRPPAHVIERLDAAFAAEVPA